MIFQPKWNPKYANISDKERSEKTALLVRRGVKGFKTLDWAFMQSSNANMAATGSGINKPNAGATAWDLKTGGLTDGAEKYAGTPERTAEIIKSICAFYGADLVGICNLNRNYVYSHYYSDEDKSSYPIVFSDEKPEYADISAPVVLEDKTQVIPSGMKYAVVMLFDMDATGIATAPSMLSQATTRSVYSKMSFTVSSVAEFIRGLGYNAIPSLNDTALSIPLAVDAGLGECGRNAKLINPLFGPRCRICKVITDLPMAIDSPITFGVEKFCESCSLCAEHCPSKSIPLTEGKTYAAKGDFSHSAVKQWQLNHDSCRAYWAKTGTNCGICLYACPYNDTKSFRRWLFVSASASFPQLDKLLVKQIKKHRSYKRLDPEKLWEQCDGK